jgi:hypothetical protein
MSRISRNISIILRSERLIAQRRMAVLRRQTGMMAAAGIAAGVGLIMLIARTGQEGSPTVSAEACKMGFRRIVACNSDLNSPYEQTRA